MKLTQKIKLIVLLGLSIVMILISVMCITAYAHNHGVRDYEWTYFWVYLESCVAIIMASVSAISPFIVNRGRGKKANEKKNKVPLPLYQERLIQKNRRADRVGWEEVGRKGLPTKPLPSMARTHTFFNANGRLTDES